MTEGPSGPDGTAAQPEPQPVGPGDPNRHFDGQQWLVWNGAAWVPEAPYVPPSGGSKRTLVVVIAIVVVALLAGGAFVATRIAIANKDIVVPSSLGGLSKATQPELIAAADQFRKDGSTYINDAKSDSAAYGDSGDAVAFLIVARAGTTPDEFFSGAESSGVDISDVTAVGDAHCVTAQAQGVSVCMRSSGSLMVAVVLTPPDTTKAASMVDEAWNLQ